MLREDSHWEYSVCCERTHMCVSTVCVERTHIGELWGQSRDRMKSVHNYRVNGRVSRLRLRVNQFHSNSGTRAEREGGRGEIKR